jgi:hypothetical protein
MTPGLRTPAETEIALLAEPVAPALLPEPWRVLIQRLLPECAAAVRRNDVYNDRDQAILPLALRLLLAGRHAAWTLAYFEAPGLTQVNWQTIAYWHHAALVALQAGWQRRLPVGINRALTLEANTMNLAPLAVRVTDNADRWLIRLARDPLDLTASEARLGLQAIPAGVWVSP